MAFDHRGFFAVLTVLSLIFTTMTITTPTYVRTVFGQNTTLYVDPPSVNKTHDDIDTTFEVNVTIAYVTDLQGFEFNVTWDDSLITLTSVDFTTTLNIIWGKGRWFSASNMTGVGWYNLAALSTASSFTGSGPLCTLVFYVQDPQTNFARNCSIHFDMHNLSDSQVKSIEHTPQDGNYTIEGREATVLIAPVLVEKTYLDVGATFKVNVTVESVAGLFGFDVNITWDAAFLNFSNFYYNDTLNALWGSGQWFVAESESGPGYCKFVALSTASSFNTTRSQSMVTLEFIVGIPSQPAETAIHFATDKLSNAQAENITHLVQDGTYRFGNSLSVAILGSGSVAKSPDQIAYLNGTIVTLTAFPAVGWSFAGWSGDVLGTANPATVNMTSSKSVSARFTQNVYTLWITIAGQGSVSLNKTGPYNYGEVIQLTATANTSWSFLSWSGNLTGSSNPATLTMTGNLSVTAHFTQEPILQMNPTSKTCRIYRENFTVSMNVTNVVNIKNSTFEIHYNTTLLDYVNVTWNAWSTGTIVVDESGGIITGSTSGNPLNGTQTLNTFKFQAAFQHLWKNAAGWMNDLGGAIFIQSANLSYATGPSLSYVRGGPTQIIVGPDFTYTFSPIQGDLDSVGTVDIFDLRLVAAYVGTNQGDPNWTVAATYDLNGDGTIDILDAIIVAGNFGYSYAP